MATTCTLDNRTRHPLKLRTEPAAGSSWPEGTYEIKADRVAAPGEAIFLKLNRDEGITTGDTFLMTTYVELRDEDNEVLLTLNERLVGLAIGSDIWAKITSATDRSTGWVTDGSKSVRFEFGGQEYNATLKYVPTSGFDDLQYTITEIVD